MGSQAPDVHDPSSMDTIILTSDDDDASLLSTNDEEEKVPEFTDPNFKAWWARCTRNYAEHRYNTSAQRVDLFTLNDKGQICPPTLFLTACEQFRKKCFIEAWVEANKWLADEDTNFGDSKLYEKAALILLMTADDIKKQLAGIKV